jgi:hypothetical protein
MLPVALGFQHLGQHSRCDRLGSSFVKTSVVFCVCFVDGCVFAMNVCFMRLVMQSYAIHHLAAWVSGSYLCLVRAEC